jgi:hypothetical protein
MECWSVEVLELWSSFFNRARDRSFPARLSCGVTPQAETCRRIGASHVTSQGNP